MLTETNQVQKAEGGCLSINIQEIFNNPQTF